MDGEPSAAATTERFSHEVLLYAGTDEFVTRVAPFLAEGVAAGDAVRVVVSSAKIALLREALGERARAVEFADMAEVGRNPARIIPAWADFVARHSGASGRLRGVGEPISPERRGEELVECQLHEALLNVAFPTEPDFRLVCPYDTQALDPDVVREAMRSHPALGDGVSRRASDRYCAHDPEWALDPAPLPESPAGAACIGFQLDTLRALRDFVREHALAASLPRAAVEDLVLAVNEVATNSVRYGGAGGNLLVWRTDGALVCEVAGGGRLSDPLAGRRRPAASSEGGRGLWLANQLCDLVQLRSGPAGTVVRLHKAT